MRFDIRPLAAVILLCCLIAGCGGGSHKTAVSSRTGKATFVVKWPVRTTRVVPVASNSILVTITRNGTPVGTQLLVRPYPSHGNENTTAIFDALPVGNLVATATAFPNADGTGVAQATGTAGLLIQPGANTTITLTMGTTITNIVVAPAVATLVYGSTQNNSVDLVASAMDADGNVVLTSGSTYTWSSQNDRIATVTGNGATATVTAKGIGAVDITATESESRESGHANVKVQGRGLLANAWAKFRSDAANTGTSAATGLFGFQHWAAATDGPVESSPAVGADGTVYAGSSDGKLYALNPLDGSTKWSINLGGRIKSSPTIATDGTIYTASTSGIVAAVDKIDGDIRWSAFFFGGSYTSSPTLGPDGTLYIAGEDGVVRALDGATGEEKWETRYNSAIQSSPAISVDGSAIYIGGGDQRMHALRTSDGSEIWFARTNGAIQSSPALDVRSNILYFGADDGRVYALRASDGSSVWDGPFATGSIVASSPALVDLGQTQAIAVGSSDGRLYLLDAASGSQLATPFQANGSIRSSPAVSKDGTIVFGSDDSTVYGVQFVSGSTGGGILISTFNFRTSAGVSSSPALAIYQGNGLVYVGSTDSRIYALGID